MTLLFHIFHLYLALGGLINSRDNLDPSLKTSLDTLPFPPGYGPSSCVDRTASLESWPVAINAQAKGSDGVMFTNRSDLIMAQVASLQGLDATDSAILNSPFHCETLKKLRWRATTSVWHITLLPVLLSYLSRSVFYWFSFECLHNVDRVLVRSRPEHAPDIASAYSTIAHTYPDAVRGLEHFTIHESVWVEFDVLFELYQSQSCSFELFRLTPN